MIQFGSDLFDEVAGKASIAIRSVNAQRSPFWRLRALFSARPPRLLASKFDHLFDFAKEVAAKNPGALFDLVRLYAKPLQADLLTSCAARAPGFARAEVTPNRFFSRTAPSAWLSHWDQPMLDASQFAVDLACDPVLPCPWLRDRYMDALADIGGTKKKGVWKQDHNHKVILWLPWGIGFVHGGNHSIAIGMLAGEGAVTPTEVWDMGAWVDAFETDGKHFFERASGRRVCKPADPYSAALFEVGRLMRQHGVIPCRAEHKVARDASPVSTA